MKRSPLKRRGSRRDWSDLYAYCQEIGHCMVPGCRDRWHLTPHHVQKRSQGGGDDRSNIAVLCGWHHTLADLGWLVVTPRWKWAESGRGAWGWDFTIKPGAPGWAT